MSVLTDLLVALQIAKVALIALVVGAIAWVIVRAVRRRRAANAAIRIAVKFGNIDGEHHKTWVIDQMVRTLAGKDYANIVARAKDGSDGPDTYAWDEGIAP